MGSTGKMLCLYFKPTSVDQKAGENTRTFNFRLASMPQKRHCLSLVLNLVICFWLTILKGPVRTPTVGILTLNSLTNNKKFLAPEWYDDQSCPFCLGVLPLTSLPLSLFPQGGGDLVEGQKLLSQVPLQL